MSDDLSPGQQAFGMAFLGGGLITVGMICAILLSFLVGGALFVLGGLVVFVGAPLTYYGAKKNATS